MKNILIILAHPKKDSFSSAMADTYMKASQDRGDNSVLLDLYRCKYQQSFFTYGDANTLQNTDAMKFYQEKIQKADELVFIFPYWWGSYPAILKNFFDWNLSKGFAFTYINSRPKGLLEGKKVKVFTTTGAPKFFYTFTGANRRLKNMIKEQIVEFCGMKLDSFNSFGSVDTNRTNTDKILEQIKTL